jgi:2-polyprenyl-3-methyl-5-hydroxy-6-metoxy-1,4-benzoquinol methylase
MEEGNLNTKEYWNINYKEGGFYQDKCSSDWEFYHDFIKKVLPSKPSKILEVACGLAHNAKFAAGLGHSIVATDFSAIAIEASKARFSDSKIRYECMTIEEACRCFRDIDIIMAFEILEHFKDPIFPLLKISKALDTGGMFIFSVPNETGKLAIWEQHYFYFNYDNMTKLLLAAGFSEVRFYKTMFNRDSLMGVAIK